MCSYYQNHYSLILVFVMILIQTTCRGDNDTDLIPDILIPGAATTVDYEKFDLEDLAQKDLWCKFQPYLYKCGKSHEERSYSYDLQQQSCVTTSYGHCKYAYNNFRSMEECKQACDVVANHPQPKNVTSDIYCRFQPEFGDCQKYFPSFYYDINENACIGFSFSGCGGNYNRFPTSAACKLICEPIVKHSEM